MKCLKINFRASDIWIVCGESAIEIITEVQKIGVEEDTSIIIKDKDFTEVDEDVLEFFCKSREEPYLRVFLASDSTESFAPPLGRLSAILPVADFKIENGIKDAEIIFEDIGRSMTPPLSTTSSLSTLSNHSVIREEASPESDIESDMENYVKYRLVGGRIKFKKGVVPHKFECQKPINVKPERSAVHKRNQIKFFEKLLHEDNPLTSVIPKEVFVACFQEDDVIENQLNDKNNQSIKKSINHKAVQVKLKNKIGHKATITEGKYFKKKKNNTVKKSTMKYKQLMDSVSISSLTDSSSITSTKHEGYGGRATDSTIFENCGILQALPKGSAVLADRGFKNVAHLLQQHGYTLIRPPSVSYQAKPTKLRHYGSTWKELSADSEVLDLCFHTPV
ncbi:hypothetical protein JTB14_017709 [Gonioctena quinquepunctata]|nr:hypothetical protein JTB14_017709 [Gonioctena quinquepunctata]